MIEILISGSNPYSHRDGFLNYTSPNSEVPLPPALIVHKKCRNWKSNSKSVGIWEDGNYSHSDDSLMPH